MRLWQVVAWPLFAVFGVTQWGMEGSRRLHQGLSEKASAKLRGKKPPRALVERRLAVRQENGTLRHPDRWGDKWWQQWQLDLLGTAPDAERAARFGRTGYSGEGNAQSAGEAAAGKLCTAPAARPVACLHTGLD
jgi:hypothetical protein